MLVGRGDPDRVGDILVVRNTLLVIDLEVVRVIEGVSVGVGVIEGGTPTVPAKL